MDGSDDSGVGFCSLLLGWRSEACWTFRLSIWSLVCSFGLLCAFEVLSGLRIALSLCLGYFSNSEFVFWCAVCKTYPALMWVATSSIRFGEAVPSGFAVVLRFRLSSPCSVFVFVEVLFGGFLVVTVWVSHSCSKELSSVLGGAKFPPELVFGKFDCQPSSSSTARVEIRLLVVSLAEACS
ncbi:hypothetical protein Bca101_034986 [Brassica carinata]